MSAVHDQAIDMLRDFLKDHPEEWSITMSAPVTSGYIFKMDPATEGRLGIEIMEEPRTFGWPLHDKVSQLGLRQGLPKLFGFPIVYDAEVFAFERRA